MSALTPQERAAVERAKEWSVQPSSESDVRIRSELNSAWMLPPRAWILPSHAATYACGHLSGFRAGVEAALEIVNRDFERGRLGSYTLDSIRSLLTQEPQ